MHVIRLCHAICLTFNALVRSLAGSALRYTFTRKHSEILRLCTAFFVLAFDLNKSTYLTKTVCSLVCTRRYSWRHTRVRSFAACRLKMLYTAVVCEVGYFPRRLVSCIRRYLVQHTLSACTPSASGPAGVFREVSWRLAPSRSKLWIFLVIPLTM